MSVVLSAPSRWGELAKVGAFISRDFATAWSYRLSFVSDALGLLAQALIFSFVAQIVDESTLPEIGGEKPSYLSYVVIGIVMTRFLQVGLGRMVYAIRTEQLMGTLETLLLSPARQTTILVGSVAYDLIYMPLQTAAFLLLLTTVFGVDIVITGIGPTLGLIAAFIPFVWGLGVVSAAAVLTLRRGSGVFGILSFGLTMASGAYFPLTLFPDPIARVAAANPIAVALQAARESLLAGAGWGETFPEILLLAISSLITMALGMLALRWALSREKRLGTLGLY